MSMARWVYPVAFAVAVGIVLALGLYLRQALRGPAMVLVGGAVEQPVNYPSQDGDIAVRELVAWAQPAADVTLLLIQATDGYAFFVSMNEVRDNDALVLSCQGTGEDASCDIVGSQNPKARVRGVSELVLIAPAVLELSGALAEPGPFDPDDWQFEMDSIRLDVGQGAKKVQGTPLSKVLQSMSPLDGAERVVVHTEAEPVTLPLAEVMADNDVRIFTIIGDDGISFALARMNGEVLAPRVTRIRVQGQ